jgi:hypothetical protein
MTLGNMRAPRLSQTRQRTAVSDGDSFRRKQPWRLAGPPMTLGNMRANGVRTPGVSPGGRPQQQEHHARVHGGISRTRHRRGIAARLFRKVHRAAKPVTAIDVALEPDATMIQHAKASNARLLKAYPMGFALDPTHLPHVTLLQQFVRTAVLDNSSGTE